MSELEEHLRAEYEATVQEVVPRGNFKRPTGYDVVVRVKPISFEDNALVGSIPLDEIPNRRVYRGMKFGIEIAVNKEPRDINDALDPDVNAKITHKDSEPNQIYSGVVYKVEDGKVHVFMLYNCTDNLKSDIKAEIVESRVTGDYAPARNYSEHDEAESMVPHTHFFEFHEGGKIIIRPTYPQSKELTKQLTSNLILREIFSDDLQADSS